MTATSADDETTPVVSDQARLPVVALIALASMGFVLVAIETMPAGLLPQIASGMRTSEGVTGLFVSAYALGTVIVTVPAITLTRGLRRKPLLLTAIAALIIGNTITALSGDVVLSLASRFVAGSAAGVMWGLLALYGRRISPPRYAGLALAIVSLGAPAGFALGTPVGAWLGGVFGWRWSFGGLSVIAVVVLILLIVLVPDVAGVPGHARLPIMKVFRIRGIPVVLAVIAVWMLAHNTIYTYISPFLRASSTGLAPDLVLLVYGVAAIAGVVVTGAFLDRHPRALVHSSVAVFVAAGVMLLIGHDSVVAVIVAAALWGLSFGGAPTQLQAALSADAGHNADVANAFLPVAFNLAIFGAGILGAALIVQFDPLVLAVLMVALGLVAFALTLYGRRSAFPARH